MLKAFGSSQAASVVNEPEDVSVNTESVVTDNTAVSQQNTTDKISSDTLEEKLAALKDSSSSSEAHVEVVNEKPLTLEEQLKNFKSSKPNTDDTIEYAGASEYRTLEDQIRFYEQNVSSNSIFGKKKRR